MVLIVLGVDKERFIEHKIQYLCALIEMELDTIEELKAIDEKGKYTYLIRRSVLNAFEDWRNKNGK